MSIQYKTNGPVAEIVIDRPQSLNALDPDSFVLLRRCLVEARNAVDVRVIILTGSGEKSFCTGSDLKSVQATETAYAESLCAPDDEAFLKGVRGRMINFEGLRIWKPVIAAINGYCIGGGMEIALQCDLRVASESASFALSEPKVGSIAGVCGAPLLMRSISSANALKLLMTGDRIDATEALRIGLVSDVWPAANLMENARSLANRIAANAPLAVQATKRLAYDTLSMNRAMALEQTEMVFGILKDTKDRIEGRRAFAEKRTPKYEGR